MITKECARKKQKMLHALKPYREEMQGIVVKSTYNWYWLVNAPIEERYPVHLVNPSAVKQYAGSNIQTTVPMPFT
jgi:hypothetical protein